MSVILVEISPRGFEVYTQVEGQKNRTVIGTATSIFFPLESVIFTFISTSGVTNDKYFLNANESLDRNSLSIKLFICDFSELPSTESIICFRRVVNVELSSLDIFFLDFISLAILTSSIPVNSLNVISLSEVGNLNGNSFLPLGNLEKSKSIGSSVDKSTEYYSSS